MLQVQLVSLRLARRENQVHHIITHLFVHMNLVHQLARLQDFIQGHHRLDLCLRRREGHAVQNFALLLERGIIEQHLEHEAVHLRFGQRISAFLIDRVLRSQHQERRGQGHGFTPQRDLPFLHRFQQGRLHLGGRAVDFVGQHKVGEHRAFGGMGFAVLRAID